MGHGATDTARNYLESLEHGDNTQKLFNSSNFEILKGEGAATDYEESIKGELK